MHPRDVPPPRRGQQRRQYLGPTESLPGAARWAAAGQAALADAQTAPELPLSLWLQFTRSGDRAKWEHAYFARRRTLCALAMAEAVTNRGTYLPALADLAWRICEESAWQLPAHNSYIRDTPQLPLPDVTRPIVDLFAAETGALIATVVAHCIMWAGRIRVVFRQYMRGGLGHYLGVQALHLVTLAVCMGGSYALCARMPGGWLGLVPRIFVVLVVPNALNLAVYGWGKDAAYLRQYAGKVAKKLLKK